MAKTATRAPKRKPTGKAAALRKPKTPKPKTPKRVDADSMAQSQREISVSEFFAKNRHLLGFDNPRKAVLTTVKEAVDNALDACEEAGILPDLFIRIDQLAETRFRVTLRDNGPGIVRSQIDNIFGKLLYGSKFHRLKMSRGQQGIGISAAGMYGLMTTGKPVIIHSKSKKSRPAHHVELAIDTQKNRAEVTVDREIDSFPTDTGTEVAIEIEGRYNRGRQSVDEYLEQTAIANPHAQIIYQPPTAGRADDNGDEKGKSQFKPTPPLIDEFAHAERLADEVTDTTITPAGIVVYPRTVTELPPEPIEIKPHPRGVELGTLIKMIKGTKHQKLGGFLQSEFSRISTRVAGQLTKHAGLTGNTWVKGVTHADAERLYEAIQETRFMAPQTNCLSPIGVKQILAGLLKGVKAEFYTATTRDPAVYRGNPFQIEVGLAYGGNLPGDESSRVIRFANRVPLLYQQSACCAYRGVIDTSWRNYGLSQSRNAVPEAPLVIMIHMASVWVPFTSESKEAVADYDEIRKEIRLALSECGRKMATYLRRRQRINREGQRRNIFGRYIGEVVQAVHHINPKHKPAELRLRFEQVARRITQEADTQFDEDGNPIAGDNGKSNGKGSLDRDEATVIREDQAAIHGGAEDDTVEGTGAAVTLESDEQGGLFGGQ